MAYDSNIELTYSISAMAIGAGTVTRTIRGPRGKRGKVLDVCASVTTAFVGTTAAARLQVGVLGTLNAYCDMPFGTTGAPTQVGALNAYFQGGVDNLQGENPQSLPFTYHPADTDMIITGVAPTGTPAGVADAHVTVRWF